MEKESAEFYKNECEQLWKFIYDSGLDASKLVFERSPIDGYVKALRTAKEGLLAAAAYIDERSPAWKLVKAGVEACDGVLK